MLDKNLLLHFSLVATVASTGTGCPSSTKTPPRATSEVAAKPPQAAAASGSAATGKENTTNPKSGATDGKPTETETPAAGAASTEESKKDPFEELKECYAEIKKWNTAIEEKQKELKIDKIEKATLVSNQFTDQAFSCFHAVVYTNGSKLDELLERFRSVLNAIYADKNASNYAERQDYIGKFRQEFDKFNSVFEIVKTAFDHRVKAGQTFTIDQAKIANATRTINTADGVLSIQVKQLFLKVSNLHTHLTRNEVEYVLDLVTTAAAAANQNALDELNRNRPTYIAATVAPNDFVAASTEFNGNIIPHIQTLKLAVANAVGAGVVVEAVLQGLKKEFDPCFDLFINAGLKDVVQERTHTNTLLAQARSDYKKSLEIEAKADAYASSVNGFQARVDGINMCLVGLRKYVDNMGHLEALKAANLAAVDAAKALVIKLIDEMTFTIQAQAPFELEVNREMLNKNFISRRLGFDNQDQRAIFEDIMKIQVPAENIGDAVLPAPKGDRLAVWLRVQRDQLDGSPDLPAVQAVERRINHMRAHFNAAVTEEKARVSTQAELLARATYLRDKVKQEKKNAQERQDLSDRVREELVSTLAQYNNRAEIPERLLSHLRDLSNKKNKDQVVIFLDKQIGSLKLGVLKTADLTMISQEMEVLTIAVHARWAK